MTRQEAERVAGDWFMGRVEPVPPGAKQRAQEYCAKYAACSEVILEGYIDYLMNVELEELCEVGAEEFKAYEADR